MGVLCVGDLIRWRNPLYLIDNGEEIEVGTWHHAIVIKITARPQIFEHREKNPCITLMLIGPSYPSRCLELSAEMFFEIGQIQKILLGEGVWTTGV